MGFHAGKRAGERGRGGVEVLQGEPQGGAQAPPCPGVLGVPGRDSPAPPRPAAMRSRGGMEKEEEKEEEEEEETPRGQGAAGAGLGPVVGGGSRAGRFYTVPAARRLPPGAMRGRGLLCGIALSLLLPPPRPCGAPPALHERLWLREPPGSGGAGAGSGAPRDPPAAGAEPQPEVVEPRWAAPGSPGGQQVGRARRLVPVLFATSASFAGRGGHGATGRCRGQHGAVRCCVLF